MPASTPSSCAAGAWSPAVCASAADASLHESPSAQNDAANMFNPGLYSRFDWVVDGEDVFVCQAAFDKATAQDAAAVAPSDDSDPLNGGCGGMFPWTQLLPEE